MELLLWFWIYDRRFLFGICHGKALFIYLWLIPFIVSVAVLPYALFEQTTNSSKDRTKCDKIDEVEERAQTLTQLNYFAEFMLCMSMITSLGMVLRSRNVFNRVVTKQKYAMTSASSSRRFDYMWQVRDQSVKSWIGYLALFIGLLNYFTSINYAREYILYSNELKEHNLDEITCEVAGSWIILSYSILFEVALGTVFFLICITFILVTGLPAIGIGCPVWTINMRKRMRGLPRNEFR